MNECWETDSVLKKILYRKSLGTGLVTHWSPTRMNGCWEAARLTRSSTQTLSICVDRVSLHRLSKWINIHSFTCPIWQNEWMDVGTDSVFHTDFANLMERNQPKPVVETEMAFWMIFFTLNCFHWREDMSYTCVQSELGGCWVRPKLMNGWCRDSFGLIGFANCTKCNQTRPDQLWWMCICQCGLQCKLGTRRGAQCPWRGQNLN